MRIVATGLLVVMAGLFLLGHRLEQVDPTWGYLRAFAEAGLVGGLADWFAVTALFRRPLGLPIPHTAIIPENKDRIADTMARFLQSNFLIPQVVARRMRGMNVAQAAGDFLAAPKDESGVRSRIAGGAGEMFAELLESLDPQRLGMQVRAGLAGQLEKLEIAPLLGRMLESAIADKRHLPLLDTGIRWAGNALESNENMVRTMVHERAYAIVRWTGLDEKLANSVLDGLYRLLAEIAIDVNHPVRGKIEEGLASLAHDLQHDPETRAKVEKAKAEMLANPALADWWMAVWERIRLSLIDSARNPAKDGLGAQMGSMLGELGRALQSDERLQWQINRFARRTAVGVATRYGSNIVQLVSETVRRWDARTLTGRLEGAVGRDLQFIRVNGTLVGGLVGVTLHFLLKFI
ncbi:DUF445 domain-containing protein [Paraurantiacibacter namhicola]|nr:DUF445 domain-containing protein [Paraurantiacibacter namhicola]